MCLLHIIVGFDHSNSFMGMLGIILDSFYMSKLERICLLLGLTVGHLLKNGRSSGQEPTILDLHVLFTGYHSKPVGHP